MTAPHSGAPSSVVYYKIEMAKKIAETPSIDLWGHTIHIGRQDLRITLIGK
jgi:hypothetical protein